MSIMSQCYSVIIYRNISAPGHVKEVLDGLNAIYKLYIYQLIADVKLPGSKLFGSRVQMHTITQNNDVSLAK